MIGFGLRLTLRGGREALLRLVLIAVAVALGTGLLLNTLAGIDAVHAQNARFAWLETGAQGVATREPIRGVDPAWWLLSEDEFDGKLIGRVDVATTGPNAPVPPGMHQLPRPGQYYASPAMAQLLRTRPAAELADRYPGQLVGTLGSVALPSPDSLIVVIGRTPAQVAKLPGATRVTAISRTAPSQCGGPCYDIGYNHSTIVLILSVVTAAMIFPILVFISTATRLSAARREQRFAAMRLVGATPRQIAVMSAVESTVASAIGVLGGFALFFSFRPLLARVPFTGSRFFTDDLSLTALDVLLMAAGVPLAAAIAATVALRKVIISPLGVTRRVSPKPPSAWRLIPLAAGLGELAVLVRIGRPATTGGQALVYTVGIVVTMAGLVVAGPWLTMAASRAVACRARRPAALLAARRLADNPQAGFRAISGLVLGLFVATVASALITTVTSYSGGTRDYSSVERGTLVANLIDFSPAGLRTPVRSVPVRLQHALAAVPGFKGQLTIHAMPGADPVDMQTVATCAELAAVVVFGHCAPGAQTAYVEIGYGSDANQTGQVWPAAPQPTRDIRHLPIAAFAVRTDASAGAIERARTLLEHDLPPLRYALPMTVAESQAQSANSQRTRGYQQLALVVIVASLAIAGCTLAVSAVTGVNDRRRPFSLLRLSGAPVGVLRRVVTLEAAVPLLAAAAVSIGAAFLASYLFLRSQLSETLHAPGASFYAVTAAGLAASLAEIASTLPLLERVTGPDSARTD